MTFNATSSYFFETLTTLVQKPVRVKINDNRQTMLSVKWGPTQTKVSIHRMFLEAPKNIMDALACYINREHKIVSTEIKAFIEENLTRFDYSHLIDPSKLQQVGKVYNLKEIFDRLNQLYFKGALQLSITWFGNSEVKNRSKCTLGLYYDSLRLIKVHRLLDESTVPLYVIEFVIFHEMTHAVSPAYIDEKGNYRAHGKEFKDIEKTFYAYERAERWIKDHRVKFFDL